ncbi:ABC transporter ATP-binding protein [Paenibacillus harenae]|uniref:Energy-coupling factor transport system ATP-binding protein n=1 Tax=Paenibacillus harenae TaxID=306543 RepID=A0ABT9UCY8_PAEHA|nr:ATP-binding cassette domain-containing protein [Paenibacillus harenae]MDQ0116309.1 energy-coupling factor transport system ATP-binding protein [Paenibacillus harenae]
MNSHRNDSRKEGPLAAAPIIELQEVNFQYPGAEVMALSHIHLTVLRGEFIAIAGTNGSGKSTLCKCLNGLIPNYYVGDLSGYVQVAGLIAENESVSSLSRKVAYVFQDFENQLVRPTVYDEACFAPLNYGFADYRERADRALAMLGLESLSDQWIWQLSGGQKHLTALAGALSLDPDIIIVDEPVAQLDPYHARLIYDKLKLLNEQYGKTIIVIEHHTEFIADYCSKVVLMDSGTIRWVKPVQEALSSVEELEALHILPPQVTLAIRETEEQRRPDGIYPVTIPQAVDYYRTRLPLFPLQSIDEDAYAAKVSVPSIQSPATTLVQFDNVSYGYKTITRTLHPVLRGIELAIHEGDRIALVGNNGAGKSTLLKLISGIRRPNDGLLTVCGHLTKHTSPETLSDYVSYIYQNPEEMFIEDTVRKDVEYFLKARSSEDYRPFVDEVLERLRLTPLQDRDGRLLSGGQQRRATLAIGLAMQPSVMLLDEPTASLDASSRREMTAMLNQLQGRVKATVIATHDMQLVAEWANRVIVMHNGQIALDTDQQSLFGHTAVLELAGLIAPQIAQLSLALGLRPPSLSVKHFADRVRKLMGQHRTQEEADSIASH